MPNDFYFFGVLTALLILMSQMQNHSVVILQRRAHALSFYTQSYSSLLCPEHITPFDLHNLGAAEADLNYIYLDWSFPRLGSLLTFQFIRVIIIFPYESRLKIWVLSLTSPVLVSSDHHKKLSRLGDLNNRILFLTVLGAEKSKIKVLAR